MEVLVQHLYGATVDPHLRYAIEKYEDSVSRSVLGSLLLAGAPSDLIRRVTDIATEIVEAYRTYIFDTTVFRDQLEKVSYVKAIRQYLPDDESSLFEASVSAGMEYLTWMLGHQPEITTKEVLRAQMLSAHYRSESGKNAPITSEVSKQARVWSKQASENAIALERIDPSKSTDAFNQLRIALTYQDEVWDSDAIDAPDPNDLVN